MKIKNIKRIIVYLFCLLIAFPAAFAFDVDVQCPNTATPGQMVTCNLVLNQNVPPVFGTQFVVDALGFTGGAPFITSDVVTATGTFGGNNILADYSGTLTINAGEIAEINLVAPSSPGPYTVSLTNLVNIDSSTPATITIAAESVCGDGIQEPGEGCDDGAGNTNIPCIPEALGTGCQYCDTICNIRWSSALPNDGECVAPPETCSNSPQDCGPCIETQTIGQQIDAGLSDTEKESTTPTLSLISKIAAILRAWFG